MPVRAVSALFGLLGDEHLLKRVRFLRCPERFDRRDVLPGDAARRRDAGSRRLVVDQHRAGAALPEATAGLRAGETNGVTNRVEQRLRRVPCLYGSGSTVDSAGIMRHARQILRELPALIANVINRGWKSHRAGCNVSSGLIVIAIDVTAKEEKDGSDEGRVAACLPRSNWRAGAVTHLRERGVCAIRSRHDLRHDQGFAGRRRARRHRRCHERAEPADPHDRHRRQRLLHLCQPAVRPVRHFRRASGLQKDQPAGRSARCRRILDAGFRAGDRRLDRRGYRHLRGLTPADRRRGPENGRGEGHRAVVLLRPQPDRRPRAEGRRHRRQLQQRGLRFADHRRLQHQRQPLRREHHLRRRRGGEPHPVHRRDHRRAERRHRPGSAGPDGQLHARVRPLERRPDPVRLQERQQPVFRQRVVLLA